jgi:hypothetical protein
MALLYKSMYLFKNLLVSKSMDAVAVGSGGRVATMHFVGQLEVRRISFVVMHRQQTEEDYLGCLFACCSRGSSLLSSYSPTPPLLVLAALVPRQFRRPRVSKKKSSAEVLVLG